MYRVASFLLSLLLFSACSVVPDHPVRPYAVNDNFLLTADYVLLQRLEPMHSQPVDTLMGFTMLSQNDALVVAEILTIPEDSLDSVWVKVAHDQLTMGWIHESEFLQSVVPDEPISRFIHFFHVHRRACIYGLLFMLLVVFLWHRYLRASPLPLVDDLPTFYPTMFLIVSGGASLLSACLLRLAPSMWQQYYFHATLNPFEWPPLLGAYLCAVWLTLILFVASCSVVFRLLRFDRACLYILALLCFSVTFHLLFNMLLPLVLSLTLYLLFLFYARKYFRHSFARYECGNCGAQMHELGKCPRCGVLNE